MATDSTQNQNHDDSTGMSDNSAQENEMTGDQQSSNFGGTALESLRGSIVGVLDAVVREYEPQIATFTGQIAHQAVDRSVEFAQTAVARVRAQSWLRIGVAAALGIGIIAVLSYEAEQAATAGSTARKRKPLH